MIRWGITANSHDAALAVFDGTKLLYAAHSERSSGLKNDKLLNDTIIEQALMHGDPKEVHWYENDFTKRLRQIKAGQYKTAFTKESPATTLFDLGIDTSFIPNLHIPLMGRTLTYHQHHRSHAAAGYYTSPYTNAAVLVIDSIGEFETLTMWHGKGDKLTKHFSQSYPNSIGLWYSAMTQRIGLKPNEDEYILMGWAAIGDKTKYADMIYDEFFEPLQHGSLEVKFKRNLHRGCQDWGPELNSVQDYADIAAGVQAVYERVFRHLCFETRLAVNTRRLVLMGGCALNCVANAIAFEYFDDVWIMPNPGDAGSAIGCVLDHLGTHVDWDSPYLGYNIEGEYPVEAAMKELTTIGMVGVASGKAEFGPRALGNRSLLADPRGTDMQDLVNTVKQRQSFRPFAPVIMEEHLHEYFDMPKGCDSSPYMQFVGVCKRPDLFPAISHYDNTSRVQTVTKEQHVGLYRLLEAWYKETGCPMLLNTSLNIKGEPMVDTEADAERWTQQYNVKVVTKDV